jgi:hypothetical protein
VRLQHLHPCIAILAEVYLFIERLQTLSVLTGVRRVALRMDSDTNGSVVYDPLQALVHITFVCKGIMDKPL